MYNQQLADYIAQARKSGMGDDQIRQNLVQAGWPVADIYDSFSQRPGATPPIVDNFTRAGGRGISRLLIFLVIGLLVAGAGYLGLAYYLTNFQNLPLWPFEAPLPSGPAPIISPTP